MLYLLTRIGAAPLSPYNAQAIFFCFLRLLTVTFLRTQRVYGRCLVRSVERDGRYADTHFLESIDLSD